METNEHISFTDQLSEMEPITLEEMDSVKLMNRIDSKYLTTEKVLSDILDDARRVGYRALEIDGTRITPYDSLYYDTEDLKMFHDHRNRKLVRQKVRTRTYMSSGLSFLEIKRKNNKGRTKKKRMSIPFSDFMDFRTNPEASDYLALNSDFKKDQIWPVLETVFKRITLVNPAKTERLTIDTCLSFNNHRTGHDTSLMDTVIIELKQDGRASSQMKNILLDHRVKASRISKYCVAVTLTDPDSRPGRFRIKIRRIEKLINKKLTVL